ncbi:HSP20 family protein [Kibdelosporangium banguiense]|uniref:HSP20 family protein n=1 Tax=Kibdelosporangium banguiense TaxID=1365924 RepID=A0ABS4TWC0_9PSEU|nr:Hsp20/alpha crystallin family protein [Kibdelosporangium banguiense]MBP2328709.1 HSP20 family protein [Kibdelosporangium banguiense]
MTLPAPRRGGQIARWNPFGEFEDLYTRLGRLWESAVGTDSPTASAWSPLADLCETDDAYIVEVDVPGVKRDDITIDLRDDELTITGELKETEREGLFRKRTRRTGHFDYRMTLPRNVAPDQIDASLANGVLTVRIPKTETAKARRIEITER